MIADDRLDGGKQFRRRHQADGDAGVAEHGLDDFAVAEVRHDHAVLDGVAADNPVGRHLQA